MRLSNDRILVIGDTDRQVQSAVLKVLPGAHVTSIPGVFDGIAELANGQYSAVLAAAEPIERRPEAAVKTLRQLAGKARLMLFGHPTLEPLSRKMLNFGVDDYLITPSSPEELQQMFGAPPLKDFPTEGGEEQWVAAAKQWLKQNAETYRIHQLWIDDKKGPRSKSP